MAELFGFWLIALGIMLIFMPIFNGNTKEKLKFVSCMMFSLGVILVGIYLLSGGK